MTRFAYLAEYYFMLGMLTMFVIIATYFAVRNTYFESDIDVTRKGDRCVTDYEPDWEAVWLEDNSDYLCRPPHQKD